MTPAKRAPRVRMLPAGSRAFLIEPEDPSSVDALASTLRGSGLVGITDVLPAAQTILVTTKPNVGLRDLELSIHRLFTSANHVESATDSGSELVRIPVSYNGSDLDDVAAILGISVDEVIRRHTSRSWRCAFVGFAPGFGYLVSSTPGLAVPRREQSRTSVPPGSVALADGYSAVYPRRSPGGWQIIGTTTLSTWDLALPQPALIRPGHRVQFVNEPAR